MSTGTEAVTVAPAPRAPGLPWIWMYHAIADPAGDPYGITVSADRLDHQLGLLRARGLRGVGVGELLRAHSAGRAAGLVGLTFDDGYADFTGTALPILAHHDCTATVFVLAGRLGGSNEWDPRGPRRPLLTGPQILQAADAGTEIGSHGMFHRDLAGCPDEVLLEETARSRALLHELTGEPPAGFCYPYGTFDGRAVDAVRRAGYAYACAIDPRAGAGRHALPRTHISQADRGARLWAKRLRHRARRHPALEPVRTGGAGE